VKLLSIILAAAVLAAPGVLVADAVVFDNGPGFSDIGGAAFPTTSALQAEDFSLSTRQTITAVRFWALEHREGYAGSILWSIRSDNGGKPSPGIIAGDTALPSRVPTGFFNDDYHAAEQFIFQFDIFPLTLEEGHYWLTLHNGPLSFDVNDDARRFLLWDGSMFSPQPGSAGNEDAKPFDDVWSPFGERAFQLIGVPEPGTLFTLLGGAILVLPSRRRSLEAQSLKIRDAIARS